MSSRVKGLADTILLMDEPERLREENARLKSVMAQWERERIEQETKERRALQDAKADQRAVWALADFYLPPDVCEMAMRWKMDATLVEMWRGAFIEGWRAAHRSSELPSGDKP